MNAHYKFLYLI